MAGLTVAFAFVACGGGDETGTSPTSTPPAEVRETPSGASQGDRVSIDGAGEALLWGSGRRAVLLAHGAAFDAASWEEQASKIADQGNLAVAVEDIDPESILAAAEYLRADRGAASVALIGASAGADASLQALSMEPEAFDQLITLSVNSTAEGLGSEPKLFIASEEEGVADLSVQLAEDSEGSDNEALILPGSAHAQAIFDGDQADRAMDAILTRLGSET